MTNCQLNPKVITREVERREEVRQAAMKETPREPGPADVPTTTEADSTAPPIPRMLIMPVQWHDAIHDDFLPDLLSCSTGYMDDMRQMLSSTIGTVFMFMGPKFNKRIVEEVALQINSIIEMVKRMRPNWSGRTSVIAHSLGTAILYDCVRKGHIKYPMSHMFLLGGNLGAYVKVSSPNMQPHKPKSHP